jgi:DNA-binding SARP family transcriptional activator
MGNAMDQTIRTAEPLLTVRLLGRLEVEIAGAPIRLSGRHAQALAALLVLQPRPRLRDAIAADLWPECAGPSASSLRQALWLVRTGLGAAGVDPEAILAVEQDTLGINRAARIELDVWRFEELLNEGAEATRAALALYRGDLAEGLGNECFAIERERLSDQYEDALAAVAEERLAAGDLRTARRMATRLLGRDSLREEAHAVLIAAYGLSGSRSQVVRQYRRVCAILRTELGVAPLPETDAAYRLAMARVLERSAERASGRGFERRSLGRAFVRTA